jgi:hypothetical protein
MAVACRPPARGAPPRKQVLDVIIFTSTKACNAVEACRDARGEVGEFFEGAGHDAGQDASPSLPVIRSLGKRVVAASAIAVGHVHKHKTWGSRNLDIQRS